MDNRTEHLVFLGTGGSMGIPVVGCHCPVCQSESPCNQRLRPSILITIGKKRFLIDCGPDFRAQALRHHIHWLDGLLLTHAHHDHIAGVDELRAYHMHGKKPLPCLLSKETAKELAIRYAYIFQEKSVEPHKLLSKIELQLLPEELNGSTTFEGLPIRFITYEQAGMKVNGFRIGDFAYITDIRDYDPAIFTHLEGVKILVLSALRHTPSPFHLSIDEAVAFADRVQASQTWLTHISHDLDHEETNRYLPPHVRMAYDGLEINGPILSSEP